MLHFVWFFRYFKAGIADSIINLKLTNLNLNYKRSSRTPRPGFSLLECYRQKIIVLVFLIVQNPKCLWRVLLPPPSPTLANMHSILVYRVPDTEDVGLPTKFRFNFGPALQPLAGSMPVNRLRRWPSINLSPGLLYSLLKHVSFNQYCLNVDPQSSTLARYWNSIGWLYRQKHQITRFICQMLM